MNKIYTKSGDKGKTGLIGGTRVLKSDERLDAYGTIDELNSYLGLIRSYPISSNDKETIIFIQTKMLTIGAYLATDQEVSTLLPHIGINDADILQLEDKIDEYEENLPILTNFVLPGGHPQVAAAHISRTVCRRAERLIVGIAATANIDDKIIQFINRLSDFLFVLSRKLSKDLNCEEIPWVTS